MLENSLLKYISTILFLQNKPISISTIKGFLESINNNSNEKEILESLELLKEKLLEIGLVLIINSNKNYLKTEYSIGIDSQLSNLSKNIKQIEMEKDLSPATLQVLTICAYLGTSSKNEISFIRGIQSSQSIRSLLVRGLLKRDGERYSLSTEALQNLGINKIEDLPEYEKIKQDFTERLQEVLSLDKEGDK